MTSPAFARVHARLASAMDAGIFPAAVAEIGTADGPIWREAFGRLTFDADSRATTLDTLFDLASLTKPLATTMLALDLNARRLVDFAQPIATEFADWRGEDRAMVTVRDLLEHCAGLPARLLDRPPSTRREFEFEIGQIPLDYHPRTKSVYSDLGFILLGFLLEDRAGQSLDDAFRAIVDRLRSSHQDTGAVIGYGVAAADRSRTAPTRPLPDDPRRPRLLTGDVHDNYAMALGGVAGHAGLFGNAAGVGVFARACLNALQGNRAIGSPFLPDEMARATCKSDVPNSSRALGWDTMLPTSSCGTRMSPLAFGHVGHTGVSLWIDPARDRYFTLLTNRVCGDATSEAMQQIRREFHNLAADI
ncbi:MAG: serine hydrolase [Acidobacteriaceae bacterium]|jgi:CubicO group peptidase (beta-lactamase class C family)|nr:serine hydrolase [Acidobacteriaceae bacterium]